MATTEEQKTIIAFTALICLTALQVVAWATGHDGVVFAFTSGVFGAIIGFYFNVKSSIRSYVDDNQEQKT